MSVPNSSRSHPTRGRRPTWIAVLAALCSLIPLQLSLATETGSQETAPRLRGTVLDDRGAPLAGATLRALPASLNAWQRDGAGPWVEPEVTQTDEAGRFRFEPLDGDSFSVRAEMPGRAPLTWSEIPAGASLSLRLLPGREVQGRTVDRSGAPLAGVSVLACDAGARTFGETACLRAESDAEGRFTLSGLAEEESWIQGRAAGRSASAILRLPAADARSSIELRLEPGAWLHGQVVDQEGRPRAAVRVEAHVAGLRGLPFANSTAPSWPLFTDAEGRFVVPGVPAGNPIRLRAVPAARAARRAGPWTLQAGADHGPVRIVDPDPATVTWRFVDGDDAPVVTEVDIRRATVNGVGSGRLGVPVGSAPVAGVDGSYRLTGLEPGDCALWLFADGWLEVLLEEVSLISGEETDLGPIRLEPGTPVGGLVSNTDRRPIAGARITALYSGPHGFVNRATTSDEQGLYRLAVHPDAENFTLSALADGHAASERRKAVPGDLDVDFELRPHGSATGLARLEDGSVVTAYTIHLHAEPEADVEFGEAKSMGGISLRNEAVEDEEGRFELTDLAPGRYTFEFRAPDLAPELRPGIEIESGEMTDVGEVELTEGIHVRGRVVRLADASPVAQVKIDVRERQLPLVTRPSPVETHVTNEEGLFELRGLAPGIVTVTAKHPEFAEDSVELDLLPEADPPELVLRLARGGRVIGTVRDADGRPTENVTIVVARSMLEMIDGQRARTGADGRYEVDRVAPNSYRVVRLKSGNDQFDLESHEAVVHEGETVVVDFDESSRIRLEGTVLRRGAPLPGATLLFMPGDGSVDFAGMRSTNADAAGRYEIGLERPGRYRVAVQGVATQAGDSSFASGSVDLEVPDEPRVQRDVVLRDGLVSGRVTAPDGAPIAGAQVTARPVSARPEDLTALEATMTGQDGHYRIDTLSEDGYLIAATAPGYQVAITGPVPVGPERPATGVDLELTPGRSIRGRVLDPNGRGLPGAMVLVAPSGNLNVDTAANTQTDVNGSFRLTAPSDGPVDLSAIGAGWAPARLNGYLPPTEPDAPELILQAGRGATLLVRTVDDEGVPLPTARVRLTPTPPYLGAELTALLQPTPPTGADGTLRIDFLAPGVYRIDATLGDLAGSARIALPEGAETPVEIRLRPAAAATAPAR